MKFLITGNHACANRGDAAILRGLLHYLDSQSGVCYLVTSRHPDSASYFMGITALPDILFIERINQRASLLKKVYWRLLPYYLALLISLFSNKPTAIKRWLPGYLRRQVDELALFDSVIQVGGSFFVDIYGTWQFEHAICAIVADKPLYLAGHSIGPFNGWLFRLYSRFVFKHVSWCGLREQLSELQAKQAGIALNNPVVGADTAWLVPSLPAKVAKTNTIAITVRDITPFSKRLGIEQREYEMAIASLVDHLTTQHYKVTLYSTCTGIDGYANDDRMVAWRISSLCQHTPRPQIEMRELNDVELGHQLATCRLTIATRLHSAIISMNFGTPAVAINYEHKSAGIYTDMNISDYAVDMTALKSNALKLKVDQALQDQDLSVEVEKAVQAQRNKATQFISSMLKHNRESVRCG